MYWLLFVGIESALSSANLPIASSAALAFAASLGGVEPPPPPPAATAANKAAPPKVVYETPLTTGAAMTNAAVSAVAASLQLRGAVSMAVLCDSLNNTFAGTDSSSEKTTENSSSVTAFNAPSRIKIFLPDLVVRTKSVSTTSTFAMSLRITSKLTDFAPVLLVGCCADLVDAFALRTESTVSLVNLVSALLGDTGRVVAIIHFQLFELLNCAHVLCALLSKWLKYQPSVGFVVWICGTTPPRFDLWWTFANRFALCSKHLANRRFEELFA